MTFSEWYWVSDIANSDLLDSEKLEKAWNAAMKECSIVAGWNGDYTTQNKIEELKS